jgi:hypothetical protein
MGFITYFLGLAISCPIALVLWGVLDRGMHRLQLRDKGFWRSAIVTAARALPFAFAFAPTLLMKRGLGVLLPASIYLFPELVGLPFQSKPLDTDDKNNLSVAITSFIAVWLLASFVVLVRQACKETGVSSKIK